MLEEKLYVPILKWKMGEQKALELLTPNIKRSLSPLLEIVPPNYDFKNRRYSKTIDDHLKGSGKKLKTSWGSKAPVFLDLLWLNGFDRLAIGVHPLEFIIEDAFSYNINIIPVTGTDRSNNYNKEVLKVFNKYKLGICFRLRDDDFLDIGSRIKQLQKYFGVSPQNIDLIVDLKYISPEDTNKNLVSIENIIKAIPDVMRWRSIVLCGTSFPENLSKLPNDSISSIPRSEWAIQKKLKNQMKLKRIPIYGDYVIAHPSLIELDPRITDRSAGIRYTVEDSWLICKGRSVKRYGGKQTYALSQMLINREEYCGRDFSWGDRFLYDCANKVGGPGSAMTWRCVGTNHHLQFIMNSLQGSIPNFV